MKVSIITVCHNQLKHTKRFIASLKRFTPQEPHQWELIVVDSGCTDETMDSIKGQFEYVQNTDPKTGNSINVGWIKGINSGLDWIEHRPNAEEKTPDIIIFCNNDVVLDSQGWLERLLAHFDNPTVGAVGPTSNYVMGLQNTAHNMPHIKEQDTNCLVFFFVAIRKSVIDECGPLEENLAKYIPDLGEEQQRRLALGGADDLDYSMRIRQAGYKLVIARDVFVWHSGSRTFMEVVGADGYNDQWQAADLAFERKWGQGSRAELMQIPTRYAIALPMRGNYVNWLFAKSLMNMTKPANWFTIESRRCLPDQARNAIVDTAIKGGIDYILFLDDDHAHPPDLMVKLIGHQKDIVGALCYRRQEPFGPCLFRWQTSTENGNLMVYEMPELINTGLKRVDAIGFGAVLIKTEVFKRLQPEKPGQWFRFDEVGEDLHFCDLCAKAGVEIYCDTSLVSPHINDDGILVDTQIYLQHQQARLKAAGVGV